MLGAAQLVSARTLASAGGHIMSSRSSKKWPKWTVDAVESKDHTDAVARNRILVLAVSLSMSYSHVLLVDRCVQDQSKRQTPCKRGTQSHGAL